MNHPDGGQHERERLILERVSTKVRMDLAWFSERKSPERVVRGTCQQRVIPIRAMATEKQENELNAVRLFCESGRAELKSRLWFPDQDPPDIMALVGGQKIGIEVRRMFADERRRGGSRDRQRASACQKVVDTATALHSQITEKFFHVNVSFHRSSGIRDDRIGAVANMLVDIITQQPLLLGETFYLRSEDFFGSNWPEEVLCVSGGLIEGDGPPSWGCSSNAFVDETSDELIQTALNAKEGRFNKFADKVDKAWLLLICDGSVEASLLRPHKELSRSIYTSSFHRVCILDFEGKTYSELLLRSPNDPV